MKSEDELKCLRKAIDKIDNQIMALLGQRCDIAKKIGQLKVDNNIPITNSIREGDLKIARIKQATELGLCPGFVAGLWSKIISHSRSLQEKILREKRNESK